MEFDSFQRPQPTINVSALLDVVFILLIFVVLAANFDRLRELEVQLPGSESTAQIQQEALVLTIPLEGPMLLDGQPVVEEDLRARLEALRADYEVLLLASDAKVELERAVRIFDQASVAGFESISIATGPAEAEGP